MRLLTAVTVGLLALAARVPATANPVTFALDPVGGDVVGAPGDDVGWGFEIDSPTDYILIDSFDFLSATAEGTFTDYSQLEPTPVIGPAPESSVFSQTWDQAAITGAGEFDISPLAVPGAVWDGTIVLTYDLYSVDPNDPNFDPVNDLITSGNQISQNASITVVAPVVSPTPSIPEPGLGALACLLGIAIPVWARARRRRLIRDRYFEAPARMSTMA